jgi:hypothetical protein
MSTLKKLETNLTQMGLNLNENDISSIHILLLKLAECEHQYYLSTKNSPISGKVKTIGEIGYTKGFEDNLNQAA